MCIDWQRLGNQYTLTHKSGKSISKAGVAYRIVLHPEEQAAHNASKAGVVSSTQMLALEWAEHGIHANCISEVPPKETLIEVRFQALEDPASDTLPTCR